MDTVLFRFGWLSATRDLSDAQYREFVNKVASYGFSECAEEVSSDDVVVNALLEMVKPSIRQSVSKYLNTSY